MVQDDDVAGEGVDPGVDRRNEAPRAGAPRIVPARPPRPISRPADPVSVPYSDPIEVELSDEVAPPPDPPRKRPTPPPPDPAFWGDEDKADTDTESGPKPKRSWWRRVPTQADEERPDSFTLRGRRRTDQARHASDPTDEVVDSMTEADEASDEVPAWERPPTTAPVDFAPPTKLQPDDNEPSGQDPSLPAEPSSSEAPEQTPVDESPEESSQIPPLPAGGWFRRRTNSEVTNAVEAQDENEPADLELVEPESSTSDSPAPEVEVPDAPAPQPDDADPPASELKEGIETTAGVDPAPTSAAPSRKGTSNGKGLLAVVGLFAVAAVAGMVALWPVDVDRVPDPQATGGEMSRQVAATIESVTPEPCRNAPLGRVPAISGDCAVVAATTTDGDDVVLTVDATQLAGGLDEGDRITVGQTSGVGNQPMYELVDRERSVPLAALIAGFALLLVVVARVKGARTVAALTGAIAAITYFVLPSIRDGNAPLWVALSAGVLLAVVAGYLVHGINRRTSAAIVGTVIGLGATGAVGYLSAQALNLTGVDDDNGRRLMLGSTEIDPRQIAAAAAVIAAVGILLDLTSRQAAVRGTFREAMSEGRTAISSSMLTLLFAFAGAALIGLLIASSASTAVGPFLTTEAVATELARVAVCGFAGLVAVPVTAWLVSRGSASGSSQDAHGAGSDAVEGQ